MKTASMDAPKWMPQVMGWVGEGRWEGGCARLKTLEG